MPTTTNYGWTTPADTDLVKDGASAIRTLGSSIDSTLKTQIDAQIPDSLLTTTGDVIYASGASTPARLGIGSTNQVLTVSGGLPAWVTPSGATKSYSLINAGGTALSGSTVTISGISGKNDIFVWINGLSCTGVANPIIRFNTDSGANYTYMDNPAMKSRVADTEIELQNLAAAATTMNVLLNLTAANSTGVKPFTWSDRESNGGNVVMGNGYYFGTSTISSVSVIGGTFDAGTIFVYGA
jgi:hypothetical protein